MKIRGRIRADEVRLASRYYRDYLRRDGGSPRPLLHVSIDLTYRCNLRCAVCFLYGRHLDDENPVAKEIARRKELSIEEWTGVFDQLRAAGVSSLVLSGGEVFLKPGFLRILDEAKRRGFKVSVLSNGSLITEARAEELVRIGPQSIRFSLDGGRETHDAICRVAEFDALMSALDRINAVKARTGAKHPRLGFETVIQRLNQSELPRIVEIAAQKGVRSLLFSNVFFIPSDCSGDAQAGQATRGESRQDVMVDPETVRRSIKEARAIAKQCGISLDCRMGTREEISSVYHDAEFSFLNKCFYPWLMARINPYGELIPCTGSTRVLGDLRRQSFLEAWDGSEYRAFRREIRSAGLFPECRKCNTLSAKRWRIWNYLPRAPRLLYR